MSSPSASGTADLPLPGSDADADERSEVLRNLFERLWQELYAAGYRTEKTDTLDDLALFCESLDEYLDGVQPQLATLAPADHP